ncbi:hypothetical protein EAI_14874 [Harpegnathos saltator]|uniref:Uncharacterized protein n=1 Tax=Harpegnathos saltator TaxID=610380 RepID=E2BGU7_HARSA|nr:hypothetical protein EAI_14874 [Harpegnathos saltator]
MFMPAALVFRVQRKEEEEEEEEEEEGLPDTGEPSWKEKPAEAESVTVLVTSFDQHVWTIRIFNIGCKAGIAYAMFGNSRISIGPSSSTELVGFERRTAISTENFICMKIMLKDIKRIRGEIRVEISLELSEKEISERSLDEVKWDALTHSVRDVMACANCAAAYDASFAHYDLLCAAISSRFRGGVVVVVYFLKLYVTLYILLYLFNVCATTLALVRLTNIQRGPTPSLMFDGMVVQKIQLVFLMLHSVGAFQDVASLR